MKILILGSEGQIGNPLCEFLKNQNYLVTRYDIKLSQLNDLSNLGNFNSLVKELSSHDFCYYLASDVGGAKYLESKQDSFEFIDNNVKIMQNTFKALEMTRIPFIFTSSQMAQQPHTTYGNLKLIGERYTKSIGGIFVRLWNVYGKEYDLEKSHVITDFIKQAQENGIISCLTNGEEERQFLHVEDLCLCFLQLMKSYSDIEKSQSLDISSFKWNSIKEVASICSDLLNAKIKFAKKYDQTQKNYKNDPKEDILKIWQPSIDLKTGITKIINE